MKLLACVPDSAIVASEGQFRWKQPDPSQPDFMDLVWDILDNGQLVPILVHHDEKGRLVLVDGQRRLQAIRYINARKLYRSATPMLVRCEVIDDLRDPKLAAVKVNWYRKEFGPVDVAYNVKLLLDAGYSIEQVATLYRRSEAWVYSLARIMKLPEDAISRIVEEEMSLRQAIEFTENWFRRNRSADQARVAQTVRVSPSPTRHLAPPRKPDGKAANMAAVIKSFARSPRRARVRPVLMAVADYMCGNIGDAELLERLEEFIRSVSR